MKKCILHLPFCLILLFGSLNVEAGQQKIEMPQIREEFRFQQEKEAEHVLLKAQIEIKENMDEEARSVGKTEGLTSAYILEKTSDEWVYVEAGEVRGFVKISDLISGEDAEKLYKRVRKIVLKSASLLVHKHQNKAFDYVKKTVKKTLVKKRYAVAKKDTAIYESKGLCQSRVVGTMEEGGTAFILADKKEKVMFVESGDVRGFVDKEDFFIGKKAKEIVKKTGQDELILAEEKVLPQYNTACYYTLTSTEEPDYKEPVRNSIVKFSKQFVGNPYSWGGTSLTQGADCSGFVQSIYSYYDYYLPRTTWEQAGCGTQRPISEAQPGDLIFYSKDGNIYHVAIYTGNGTVVHAANSRKGIIEGGIWEDAAFAVDLIGK